MLLMGTDPGASSIKISIPDVQSRQRIAWLVIPGLLYKTGKPLISFHLPIPVSTRNSISNRKND